MKQQNMKNNIFFYIYINTPKILDDITYNILLQHFRIKPKFKVFSYYKNDCFLNNHKYDIIENKFMTCQNHYRAFCLLAKLCKIKYNKNQIVYNKDLLFNNLDVYKSSLVFHTIEHNIPYKFLVTDVLKIIRKSLLYNVFSTLLMKSGLENPFVPSFLIYTSLPL